MRPRLYFRVNTHNITINGGVYPHIIVITPTNPPRVREEYFANEVFSYMRLALHNNLPTYDINRLQVAIGAGNIDNDSKQVSASFRRFGEVTIQDLWDLVETIQQSNETISFEDLEWHITINPNEFRRGRGKTILRYGLHDTRKNHVHPKNGPLSCMAYALTRLMHPHNPIETKVWQLMKKLGWGTETSISDVADYVKLYPNLRVVVLYLHKEHVDQDQVVYN